MAFGPVNPCLSHAVEPMTHKAVDYIDDNLNLLELPVIKITDNKQTNID